MRQRKLIYGVGINDSDYKICPKIGGKKIMCPYYKKWVHILERCYSELEHSRYPTYKGCEICEEWKYFMCFRSWMIKQDWRGKEPDKDLCGNGKLYSPETVVFVSQRINTFTTDSGAARSQYGLGVEKRGRRFRSFIRCNGATVHLGTFDTAEEAHAAWVKEKRRLTEVLIQEENPCPKAAAGLRRYAAELV